uniref:Uncharacterized protein n=1 Tax=Parascaris univalens TaxID=6257 RepID=A0A915A1W6_PARUN
MRLQLSRLWHKNFSTFTSKLISKPVFSRIYEEAKDSATVTGRNKYECGNANIRRHSASLSKSSNRCHKCVAHHAIIIF